VRTRVGIIGAGPAGLLLAQLLGVRGIESVVLENRSRDYVQARIRAGILEQGTVDLLTEAGVGQRLHREGLRHDGIYLQHPGHREHLEFRGLCGRSVWAYGQTEVVKDLIDARLATGHQVEFEVGDTALHDLDTDRPRITYTDSAGSPQVLECDVVAGCDGFHGPSREMLPADLQQTWARDYPFAWLGILADVAPSTDELIYWHPEGFAMHSMRSPSVSRLYLQVDPHESIEGWSDDRIWSELSHRLAIEGWQLQSGPITDRSITAMRSVVRAPMRHGRLFLAGDAAHIVPPTGAKGLNLAIADVHVLDRALGAFYDAKDSGLLQSYTETALKRIWRAQHFSWWMTSMLHRFSDATDFDLRRQLAELEMVTSSPTAAKTIADNYAGLPLI
jgi:p-hydroxybenzoate 3-monooxygenase